ncbi:hypothetical protein [Paenibacillus harenae]|uniref:hypothetical protein n=1 Tax=Paenibacillus harenae TaxID=306543 RepID=UPI0027D89184|nr:hypothetical protein [Paenibacillus harenae]
MQWLRSIAQKVSDRNVVMYNWEMVPSGGGEAAASGFVFLFINKNGRIRLEYQL